MTNLSYSLGSGETSDTFSQWNTIKSVFLESYSGLVRRMIGRDKTGCRKPCWAVTAVGLAIASSSLVLEPVPSECLRITWVTCQKYINSWSHTHTQEIWIW